MSFLAIGIFAAVPNLIGMGGNVIGGIVTDRLVKATGSVDKGRKIAFTCAFGLGALSMAMPWVTNDYVAVVLMGLALFGNQWVAAVYIGTVGDVVPQHLAGRVAGSPFALPGGRDAAFLTISIGMTVAGPGGDASAIVAAAEAALRQAKDDGGNRICGG